MSRRKRRESEAPLPASGAGLPAFLGEKTDSVVKIRPELVLAFTMVLIVVVILADALVSSI